MMRRLTAHNQDELCQNCTVLRWQELERMVAYYIARRWKRLRLAARQRDGAQLEPASYHQYWWGGEDPCRIHTILPYY